MWLKSGKNSKYLFTSKEESHLSPWPMENMYALRMLEICHLLLIEIRLALGNSSKLLEISMEFLSGQLLMECLYVLKVVEQAL